MNGTSPAGIHDKMDSQHPGSTIAANLASRLSRLRALLARPVDGSSLGAFRLLFGALMVWEVIRYFQHDFIGRYYIQPTFYFTYELFPFVAPLPGPWMYGLFVMILQYAHYLRDKWQQAGIANPIVMANTWVSLNGRPHQQLIDPTANLAEVTINPLAPADWILSLEQGPPHDPNPILYRLTVIAMLLANVGLALTCYLVIAYFHKLKNRPGGLNAFGGRAAEQERPSVTVTRMPAVPFIKTLLSPLPYLFTLILLAIWTTTGNPRWLPPAFFSIVVAVGWGLYLFPTLASRPSIHSRPPRLALPPVNVLTALLLLMTAIISL